MARVGAVVAARLPIYLEIEGVDVEPLEGDILGVQVIRGDGSIVRAVGRRVLGFQRLVWVWVRVIEFGFGLGRVRDIGFGFWLRL